MRHVSRIARAAYGLSERPCLQSLRKKAQLLYWQARVELRATLPRLCEHGISQ